tara:strand:- start:50 stop:397 length:348 start_codon:yes stop_codon:yes gene_type:complete
MFRVRDAIDTMYKGGANCRIENEKITVWREDFDQPTEEQIQAKQAELQAAEPTRLLRIDRDKLLAESDWTGLADSALTSEVAAKWKLYRQRLRDLPSGLNTPAKVKNVTWPTKPK